jgi:hypothetical protein
MVHRCKIQYKILLDLHRHPAVHHLHQVVNLLHLVQSRRRAVNHHLPVQHKLLLAILTIHQQISHLHKAAAVSPKQAKLKPPVIITAKQGLV